MDLQLTPSSFYTAVGEDMWDMDISTSSLASVNSTPMTPVLQQETPMDEDIDRVEEEEEEEEEEGREPTLFLRPIRKRVCEVPVQRDSPVPCPRFGHTACVHQDTMVVFGGRDSRCLNDVWLFNFLSKTWRHIPTIGDYTQRPCPRAGHTAVVHNDLMYVFGGVTDPTQDESDGWLNDLWALDLVTFKWTKIETDNTPPSRKGHTAVVCDDRMYIFGGGQDDIHLNNELWSYDFAARSWELKDFVGHIPQARMYHVAVLVANRMVVFGGRAHTATGFLNDLFEVELGHCRGLLCTDLRTSGTPPTHRMCSTAIYHNNNIAVFTGGSFDYLTDSHQLDLRTMRWQPISEVVSFGGRTRPTTVKWRNTLLTFGGCVHGNCYVNDFVEVELEPMSLVEMCLEYVKEKGIEFRCDDVPRQVARLLQQQ